MKASLEKLKPRRILVCQQRQIGDVLLTEPALALLKQRFPQAEVHLFTESKCAPLMEANPNIDVLWRLNRQEQPHLLSQLLWYSRLPPYDLFVDFQQLPRCRFLALFSRAPVRLSFLRARPTFGLYTHTARILPGYAADSKVSMLAPLGIHGEKTRPHVFLRAEEYNEADRLLRELGLQPGQILISLAPTHKWENKRWPAAYYARLIDLLAAAREECRFFLLRGPGEETMVREVLRLCSCPDKIMLPETLPDLRLSAACIARAALHIGNCSAPRHIAVGVGTPSLIIPGASSAVWLFPGDPAHQELRPDPPCPGCQGACLNFRCLTEVTPEKAAAKALEMLNLSSCLRESRGTV